MQSREINEKRRLRPGGEVKGRKRSCKMVINHIVTLDLTAFQLLNDPNINSGVNIESWDLLTYCLFGLAQIFAFSFGDKYQDWKPFPNLVPPTPDVIQQHKYMKRRWLILGVLVDVSNTSFLLLLLNSGCTKDADELITWSSKMTFSNVADPQPLLILQSTVWSGGWFTWISGIHFGFRIPGTEVARLLESGYMSGFVSCNGDNHWLISVGMMWDSHPRPKQSCQVTPKSCYMIQNHRRKLERSKSQILHVDYGP